MQFSSFWLHFGRFAHLAFAAWSARSRRSSGVRVTKLRLPPILPPFRPIADIMREISLLDALGGFRVRLADLGSGSSVDLCTMRKAAWFTSDGLLLLFRFSFDMPQVCHGRQRDQNSK